MKENETTTNEMKLFHVQDSDRPLYILAKDWNEALYKWRVVIAIENECDPEGQDPAGISLIADEHDVVK